jgi:hypothetical protein
MPTLVTLDIYSGRPNPTWELSPSQVAQLRKHLTSARTPTALQSPASKGRLGYRGFHVESLGEPNFPERSRIFDGVMDIGDAMTPNFVDHNSKSEAFLLSTAGDSISSELHSHVRTAIARNSKIGPGATLQGLKILFAPRFNPGRWNDLPKICHHNNCYNYANNKITNTFAQPGRGSGAHIPRVANCPGTGKAAHSDGQKPLGPKFNPEKPCPDGQWIALFVWPGQDYHWYRCDANRKWSHKPGPTAAKNTDDEGRLIEDPQSCARGHYTKFCGYFQCIPDKTKIL